MRGAALMLTRMHTLRGKSSCVEALLVANSDSAARIVANSNSAASASSSNGSSQPAPPASAMHCIVYYISVY